MRFRTNARWPSARSRGSNHAPGPGAPLRRTGPVAERHDRLAGEHVRRAGARALEDRVAPPDRVGIVGPREEVGHLVAARLGDLPLGPRERGGTAVAVRRHDDRTGREAQAALDAVLVAGVGGDALRRPCRRHRLARAEDRVFAREGPEERRHLDDEIREHRQVRDRLDRDRALEITERRRAREHLRAVHAEPARAARGVEARVAEHERRIDAPLDPPERLEDARPPVDRHRVLLVARRVVAPLEPEHAEGPGRVHQAA